MTNQIVSVLLLFLWFLCGLYTLKSSVEYLREHSRFAGVFNLLAVFLGPLPLLFRIVSEKIAIPLRDFLRNGKNGVPEAVSVTFLDSRGKVLFSDADDGDDGQPIAFLRNLIDEALRKDASDIFIDPFNNAYRIRFRVSGTIRTVREFDDRMAAPLISLVKVLASMDISEHRRPQDGAFGVRTPAGEASFRVAAVGVFGGEKITIRVIASEAEERTLENIGLNSSQFEVVSSAIRLPSGMVLMCGPTGSGKTSSLYAMLGAIDYNLKNVISIEDPIERVVNNISQMEVNTKAGITFASLLRNSLRQNPDIICLGEIRDDETAGIAAHAAQTGHLIIATIHSNDNIGTIDRLIGMGVPLRTIADTLHVSISQRLVRKLCPHCRKKALFPEEKRKYLKENGIDPDSLYSAQGCPQCDGVGYLGRRAVFEILVVDEGLRAVLESPGATTTMIREYVDSHQGAFTIQSQCLELLGKGILSWEEFERVAVNV